MQNWQFISDNLKISLYLLVKEIKNDIYFFGICGCSVSLLLVWQGNFEKFGIIKNPKWASDIFNDFISWRAFAFVLFVYTVLGIINNITKSKNEKLESILSHISDRLRQFGSSIISFTSGLSIFLFLLLIGTADPNAARAFFITILFASFIAAVIVLAELLVRNKNFFDKDFVAVFSIVLLVYFSIRQISS